MKLALFVPASMDPREDAGLLAAALRGLGHDARLVELPGRFATVEDAARSAWQALPPDAPRLIASACFGAFRDLPLESAVVWLTDGLRAQVADLRAAPRFLVPSESLRAQLARSGAIPEDRIACLMHGIERFARSNGSEGRACRIVSVGALVPRKGHDVLLRALRRLGDLDWTLWIAGHAEDPACAEALHGLAEQMGLAARIRFAPPPADAAARDRFWAGADLFALASQEEGYGSTIAEALRRGLPVAVTGISAIATLVPPEAAVVCAPGEVDQLSKAMRRLIYDRALRRDMAESAWQWGQTLPSWTDQAARLVEMLAPGRWNA